MNTLDEPLSSPINIPEETLTQIGDILHNPAVTSNRQPWGIRIYVHNAVTQLCNFDPTIDIPIEYKKVPVVDWVNVPAYQALCSGLITGMRIGNRLWSELSYDRLCLHTLRLLSKVLVNHCGVDNNTDSGFLLYKGYDPYSLRDDNFERMDKFRALAGYFVGRISGVGTVVDAATEEFCQDLNIASNFSDAFLVGIGSSAMHYLQKDLVSMGAALGEEESINEALRSFFPPANE